MRRNLEAIDAAVRHLQRVDIPDHATATRHRRPPISADAPDFAKRVTAAMLANKGDLLPVSAFPVDGTWPTGTSTWEKRNLCSMCVAACPVKDKTDQHKPLAMQPQRPRREPERENQRFLLALPDVPRTAVKLDVKGSQFLTPLFEYSNACAGCGETPYVKLLTQLFGDRIVIANATGCSSIYGGNLPTMPYTTDRDGRGPAWSNSLFEDNAEFGLGMRLALDGHVARARALLMQMAPSLGDGFAQAILDADQSGDTGIAAQRARIVELRRRLQSCAGAEATALDRVADYLVRKSVWIVGGDGWAYDIGYGGLDHVIAMGPDVNILVLDTEVYSNTGGQQSKATPLCAASRFAAAGKSTPKKDLGLQAMAYERAYVARVALGAKDSQTVTSFREADAFPGPSLIIAYSPCIAHGYDLACGLEHQKLAVETGHWPLYRFDPRRLDAGANPLQLDSQAPSGDLAQLLQGEGRFATVERQHPDRFRRLLVAARRKIETRQALYQYLAGFRVEPRAPEATEAERARGKSRTAGENSPPTDGV